MAKFQLQIQTIEYIEVEAESVDHLNKDDLHQQAVNTLTNEQIILSVDLFSVDKDNCADDLVMEITG